MNKLFIVD